MARSKKLVNSQLVAFIESAIPDFHAARLTSLGKLKLRDLVRNKNPYLFRAKNILVAGELVQGFLSAHLSSQEEGIFGGFLERLAMFVAGAVYGGRKSIAEGIDLEIVKDGTLYAVAIKSGPDWGNSSQVARMRDNFKKAARIIRTNAPAKLPIFVNGCCYGRTATENKGDYFKYSGQSFWSFISDDPELYRRIIEPIGHKAREHNEGFKAEYAKVLNQFTQQFVTDFCHPDGAIDWDKLLVFNSGRQKSRKEVLNEL